MEKIASIQFFRRRKFLLILPLLVLPFIILFFWILGGGKESDNSSVRTAVAGLNMKLPDPHFKKGAEKSKLSIYEEASKDSARLKDRIKNDPYYLVPPQNMSFDSSKLTVPDENAARIMQKLEKLKTVIHQKTQVPIAQIESFDFRIPEPRPQPVHDPRMDQITAMLDKVMMIQHPEILQDSMSRLKKQYAAPAFDVLLNNPDTQENINTPCTLNRFYELADDLRIEKDLDNAIEAEIPETQVLVSGSNIKLRLLNDVRINGHLIGKDQFIYGTVSLANERLKIQFSSVRSGQNILPISLEAYDLDGLPGIYIPGSINRDVAKQSTNQAISSVNLESLDPSVGAQAAGAGIQAAKTLLSRKVKLVKVTVKAGYKLLLKDSRDK